MFIDYGQGRECHSFDLEDFTQLSMADKDCCEKGVLMALSVLMALLCLRVGRHRTSRDMSAQRDTNQRGMGGSFADSGLRAYYSTTLICPRDPLRP